MSEEILLSREIQWQNFDVNPNTNYIVLGSVENELNESSKSALIIFNFEEQQLSPYDLEFNRLAISKQYGYYRYLAKQKGENFFEYSIKIPSGVKVLAIGFVLFENSASIKVNNLRVVKNYTANIFMQKNIISSKSNLDNYTKRTIFKDRWLKVQQQNIVLQNTFSYKVMNSFSKSKKSIKAFLSFPLQLIKIFKGYLKHKQRKVRLNIWRGLSSKPLTYKINFQEDNNVVQIKGKYFSLSGEKKNALLVFYTFNQDVSKEEMKKLGFLFSEKLGFFNYIEITGDGEQSFVKQVVLPANISKVQLNFRAWYNKKQILLKIITIKPMKLTDSKLDPQKEVKKYSDVLSPKDELSLLGWKKYANPEKKPIVLAVMDEFTTGCFEDEVCLIQPRPDNWLALIKMYKPDLVFIESAWKGNYGSWQYRVADYSNKPGNEIEQISQYCKQKNIPMIFWNKEDPVHHQKFMCSAKVVTHIFTTDANMIDSYRSHTGNKNAFALPFAAQPTLHKPKSLKDRINKSCFAGSWYGNRHEERGEAMKWLLEAANEYGLDIFDRNFGTGIFPFPEKYQAGIKGSLPYKELCVEYGNYRVFLNVNSVTDSPTMFSRRVFELMACGTPIVSTYAKGIEELFDTDAVWLVNTKEEALYAIKTLMTDEKEWRRRSLLGIREVFSKHTYSHRLNYIFESTGLNSQINIEPKIVLLSKIDSDTELEKLNQFIESQSYKNIILYVEYSSNNTKVNIMLNEKINLCQNLKEIIDTVTDCKAIGWIDTDINYGSFYVQDLINATVYEPSANGWAKSIDDDHFDYNKSTLLSASVWKPEIFVNQYFEVEVQNSIKDEKLFVIDSNEYTNQKNQGVAK